MICTLRLSLILSMMQASVSTVDYRIRHDLLAFVERIPDRVGNAHAKCAVGTLVDLVRDEGASPFEVLYVIAVFTDGLAS